MSAKRALVTRPIPQAGIELLERSGLEVEVLEEGAAIDRDLLLQRAGRADGVLSLLTERVDDELLRAAPRVRVVANMAVGYDNVDVPAATRRGVLVTNTPGVLTTTTADLTMALLLATARRVAEGDRFLRGGKFDRWGPLMLLGQEVSGKTLGIAGLGRIGAAVAERASLGFGMKILYWSRTARPAIELRLEAERVEKAELLERSHYLSLHLPLDSTTHHFIDAQALARMKPTAILINTSRGPLVDEPALVDALRAKRLWAAGLDVFEEEPEVHPRLLELDNLVLLPHIGSASEETRARMATMAAENLVAALNGLRPPSLVNPEAWTGAAKRS